MTVRTSRLDHKPFTAAVREMSSRFSTPTPPPPPPLERNFIPLGEEDQTPIASTCNHSLGNNIGVVSMIVRQWLPVFLISFVTDIKLSVAAEIYFSSLWFVSLGYIALLLLIYDSPLPPPPPAPSSQNSKAILMQWPNGTRKNATKFRWDAVYKNSRIIISYNINRGRISSVDRASDCNCIAGSRGFDSRGRTNDNWEIKVLPFPCNRQDLRVAWMTT